MNPHYHQQTNAQKIIVAKGHQRCIALGKIGREGGKEGEKRRGRERDRDKERNGVKEEKRERDKAER